jgi:hypothetical protein
MACKGIGLQRVQVPPDNGSLQSVAVGAGKGGNDLRRNTPMEESCLGDTTSTQAGTPGNAERASRSTMQEPNRLECCG